MRFANPHLLWFLLVIPPALVAFFWWAMRKRQQLIAQFIQARLLPSLTVGISTRRRQFRYGAILLAVICLILALARPQWGFAWEEVKQRGLDIVIAIDTSKSMLAEDIRPNRLARAKLASLDLMRLAKADRLGLVAFAGGAFLQCPLTIDDSAFRQSLESLDVNIIPQGGTALAQAIDTAESAFKEGDNHRILVILTDGEDHDSGAVDAAKTAASHDMEIFTIGIGTPKGELLTIKDAKGRTDYIRDSEGHVVQSKLNEQLLREIAGATAHGFYLPLQGANTMETLYKEGLAPLPKSESAEKLVKRYYERYHWPLAVAIGLLLFEMLLPEKRRSSRKVSVTATESGTAPAIASVLLLLCLLAPAALASPSSAMHSYQSGDYDRAYKEYERLIEKNKDDARLHFNAGASAYRKKQYEDALQQFSEALNSPDLKLQQRAYYNLGNTLFNLGADAPDPKAKTKSWEEAVKNFENSLKLNAQDQDARNNHDYVQKLLEELKKQQQQQQQNKDQNKDQKENQDKQDQNKKQDQQQNQDKKDQQSKDQQQKQDDKEKQQQQNQQDQAKKDQEKEKQQDQAKNDQQKPDQKDKQQQQGQKPEPDKNQPEPREGQSFAAGQMTPREAQQLMDAAKGEEMVMPIPPEIKQRPQTGPVKDW